MEQAFVSIPEVELGIKVNGALVNIIWYADDTILIADSQNSVQRLVNLVDEESLSVGQRVDISKTKWKVIVSGNEFGGVQINVGTSYWNALRTSGILELS